MDAGQVALAVIGIVLVVMVLGAILVAVSSLLPFDHR